MFSNIKAVRVQEIIMSGSHDTIGTIKYNNLLDSKPESTKGLPSARPLFYNFSQYPLVNEIVYILIAPKNSFNAQGTVKQYYLPPINIHGTPNHNALPSHLTPEEYNSRIETGKYEGKTFIEKSNVKPLLPYEGDIMVEGRFGNSIRFGSTVSGSHQINDWSVETSQSIGNPITIIRNGQRKQEYSLKTDHAIEDINQDDSSIYLCSNQQITNFQKAGIEVKEYELSYKHML